MRKDSVLSLVYGVSALMTAIESLQLAASELDDDGDVTELIARSLDDAYAELDVAKDDLCEYLDTEAEE